MWGHQPRVYADQTARKLIDCALTMGRREIWDFAPRPLAHNSNYVRQGDSFPDVERHITDFHRYPPVHPAPGARSHRAVERF
ncbi:MAG: hypothetical protein GY889_00025 [Proteobacteria bacterium]|nr:hypothetical protein [Pseudomonadota bacterium]